jgi:hypothetical protein
MFRYSSETRLYTIYEVAHLYHPGAHTHEEYAILLVLRVELRHDDIHGCLRCRVQCTVLHLEIINEVEIGMATGDGDNFLDLAFLDEREE